MKTNWVGDEIIAHAYGVHCPIYNPFTRVLERENFTSGEKRVTKVINIPLKTHFIAQLEDLMFRYLRLHVCQRIFV